jgi:hypothetical protein
MAGRTLAAQALRASAIKNQKFADLNIPFKVHKALKWG